MTTELDEMRKEKEKKVNSLQASVRTLQTALEEKEAVKISGRERR